MTFDHRLVQTATLGGRRSHDPVFLPMERRPALEFKDRNEDTAFWCGDLLGGCGGQLSVKIYQERVAHFAHHSSTDQCTRQRGGIDSADHLYAGKHVNRWLSSQGLPERTARFEGDFDDGGTCHRLTLPSRGGYPTIFFEFTARLGSDLRRLLSQGDDRPQTWFVRDNPGLVQRLTRSHGHALRFRMRTEGFERVVDVGTTSPDGHTWWRPIEECSLELEHGTDPPPVTLPSGRDRPRAARPPQTPVSGTRVPREVLPHPLINRLRSNLEKRDWPNVRRASERLRMFLGNATDIGITHHRDEAEELLQVSAEALRYLMPRTTLVRRPVEPAATPRTLAGALPGQPDERNPGSGPGPARPNVPGVPRQGRTRPETGQSSAEPQRGKRRKQQRRTTTAAVPEQRSVSGSVVDETALRRLQERFNTKRL
ncbi:hypothetical protein ACWFMI_15380 [Nocardiopsis terrae]